MYSTLRHLVLALVTATVTAAALTPRFDSGAHLLKASPRAACNEDTARICYGIGNDGTPQALDPDDVAYVASYLRYVGQQNSGASARWTMPAETGCSEWGLPVNGAGTVLALAKHAEPGLNTSVLYEDLASTIDGGSDGAKASGALVHCGANGGQMGVVYDASNPAYSTDEYKASRSTPEGIIFKLVRASSS